MLVETGAQSRTVDPPATPTGSRARSEVGWAAVTALVSFLVGAWSLRLWEWDPAVPIDLGWDHTYVSMVLREVHDRGWYWANPALGFPLGQNASWFPELNVLHLALVKVIDLVVPGTYTAGSLYFVASFPLTGVTMYLLSRSQGLTPAAGFLGGVLFANAPGHADRFGHLFLAQYWVVPVALWLVLEVARGRPLLTRAEQGVRRWGGRRSLVSVAAVACVGLSGVYYVAFTMVLVLAVALARRALGIPADLLRGLGVIAGLGSCIAVPLALARLRTSGDLVTGPTPATRGPGESELFAGKLMDLLLPWPEHVLAPLRTLTQVYTGSTRATVEVAALGVVGAVGMAGVAVVGLLTLLSGRELDPEHRRWSGVMLVCFLLYTVGGLGSFIAFFGTAQVRSWSRLSLYVLVLALLMVGSWVSRLQRRRGLVPALLTVGALTLVGVLDQTNPAVAPDHRANAAELEELRRYTAAVTERVEPGCGVFQLPVLPFPETLGPARMEGYDQLKPYLAGSELAYSFGAMRGTAAGDWMLAVDPQDLDALAADLRSAGFCAIEVDTAGFAPGTDPSARLTAALGAPAAATADGTFVSWILTDGATAADPARRERLLRPVLVSLDAYSPVRVDGDLGQDLGPVAGVSVGNLGEEPVEVTVSLEVSGVGEGPRTLTVSDGTQLLARADVVSDARSTVRFTRVAPPGRSSFTVRVQGPVEKEPGDDRLLAARVHEVSVGAPAGVRAVSLLEQVASGWVAP